MKRRLFRCGYNGGFDKTAHIVVLLTPMPSQLEGRESLGIVVPEQVMTRDGLRLRVWHVSASSAPTRGVVCVIHGLGEHFGRYERISKYLNSAGWSVVGYDQRGHGSSDGARGQLNQVDDLLNDLASVVDVCRGVFPSQPLVLFGHSLGGLVAARFVSALCDSNSNVEWKRVVQGCVLSSPALDIPMNWLVKQFFWLLGVTNPNLVVSNGLRPERLSRDVAVQDAYRRDPLVHNRISGRLGRFIIESGTQVQRSATRWNTPTLLQYAGNDRCVSSSGSRRFAVAAPQAVVSSVRYENMSHEIFNEPDNSRVFETLGSWLSQLQSGGSH
ncbi:MAG: lysophospholipase [Pirellula sp.]